MSAEIPISSKHPSRRNTNEFYRYYAGYPIEFAEWAIKKLQLEKFATLFDPWNGSGTTVAACAKLGFSAKGFDINPVMVHLGRARVATKEDFEEARQNIRGLQEEFGSQSTVSIRSVGEAFGALPVSNESAHSVAITSLYPKAATLFGFTLSKNPAWFRAPDSMNSARLRCDEFFNEWLELTAKLQLWSVETNDAGTVLTVERADSRRTYGRAEMFDGVLTSPPYLTRIDYVKATLPEFTLLSAIESTPDATRLRRSMLGSPLTNRNRRIDLSEFTDSVNTVLNSIKSHDSKASSSYYYNFFSSYFYDLRTSMRRISNALKVGSQGCFVVQPSNYKEILVDLPNLLIEIAKVEGFDHLETVEFEVSRSMSLVNTKAHQLARSPKSEFAVFLRKT